MTTPDLLVRDRLCRLLFGDGFEEAVLPLQAAFLFALFDCCESEAVGNPLGPLDGADEAGFSHPLRGNPRSQLV